MSILRKIARVILPQPTKKFLHELYQKYKYRRIARNYNKIIKRIKNKEKIKVAFFLIHDAVWKYEGVYRLMEKDKRFEPVVVVCPYISHGEQNMLKEMNQAYANFSTNGYNVVKTYDEKSEQWLDVKKQIQPDIVFFTNPHKLTREEYYIYNYLDCLTCYVQYSFHITYLHELQYNQPFHNLLWKAYCETTMHKQFAIKYAVNKGINVEVTGYPGTDKLIDSNYHPSEQWKIKDHKIKRIIWAPHHTIEEEGACLTYSNFLQYAELMLEIARKYDSKIQIAFKPHPLLKSKLYKENKWGKKKTEEYYLSWENLSNGQLNESDYLDLFLCSDGMIHDSASFMTEYLLVNKPVLFTVSSIDVIRQFNAFGKLSFQNHYHAFNRSEIIQFIENIIIGGVDPKKDDREAFINKYLIPPKQGNASKNIVESLKSYLNI